jgi:hypothetical protein
VRITVVPSVAVSITAGPKGINDYLTCAAVYAQRGDVVLLQVQDNGAWVKLQIGFLNRSGNKVFVLSAKRTQGKVLRCVLLGTELHARAVSAQITVP